MALDNLLKEELEALAAEHEIVIEEGSGAGGSVLKADLVEALEAASVTIEPPDPDRELVRCRVLRKWSQDTGHGKQTYAPGSLALVPFYRARHFSQTSPPHLKILD